MAFTNTYCMGDSRWSQKTWVLIQLHCSQAVAEQVAKSVYLTRYHPENKEIGKKVLKSMWHLSESQCFLTMFLNIQTAHFMFSNTGERTKQCATEEANGFKYISNSRTWRKGGKSVIMGNEVCTLLFIIILPLQGSWEQIQLSKAWCFC